MNSKFLLAFIPLLVLSAAELGKVRVSEGVTILKDAQCPIPPQKVTDQVIHMAYTEVCKQTGACTARLCALALPYNRGSQPYNSSMFGEFPTPINRATRLASRDVVLELFENQVSVIFYCKDKEACAFEADYIIETGNLHSQKEEEENLRND